MDSRQLQYLKAMDITVWQRRDLDVDEMEQPEHVDGQSVVTSHIPEASAISTENPTPVVSDMSEAPSLSWDSLATEVSACQKCSLFKTRMNAVLGEGDPRAEWMLIGEAPGADEDRQGRPFVGQAGQLLNAMLHAVGLKRESVYIANILKCRPPNNRDPKPEEAQACSAYLQNQIELIQPRLIIVLGKHAAQNLLNSDKSIGQLRGEVHHYSSKSIPVVATYHPAYLLHTPSEKSKSWSDLQLAMSVFTPSGGEK